ncbi:globin domain-containing protein [Sulfurospirillum sp.]|uniref:globin domain-containing protein n=1 Tax=Sulfurospirillum sp. TaxID=2053622 RepID=UPI002FDDE3AA
MPVVIDGVKVQLFSECDPNAPFPQTDENPRRTPPKIDIIYPEVFFPSNKTYLAIGEAKIREVVKIHHDLVRKSKIGHLYPQDDATFIAATTKIEDFFVQMLGGANLYTSKQGHPKLRDRHFPFEVNETGRDIWLMCFKKALKQTHISKELLPEIWNWVESISMRMVNRRTSMEMLKRYPYESIQHYFDA